MKKLLPLSLLMTLSLTSCKKGDVVNAENQKAEAEAQAKDSANNNLLKAVKSEQKVKDAVLTDANILYVSVVNDGSNRSGYAEYLCGLVAENNAGIDAIKVVEFGSSNSPDKDNAYGILLGESRCKK